MDNAEKKWEEFFEKANYYDLNYNREISAITDFKQSLKELIEARDKSIGVDYGTQSVDTARKWTTREILTLIDKCEPTKQ